MFLWADLGVDTNALATRLFDAGYLAAPGSLFCSEPAPLDLDALQRGVVAEPGDVAGAPESARVGGSMRFGFFFWPYTPQYTARMARLGEETGFDLIGIADTPRQRAAIRGWP